MPGDIELRAGEETVYEGHPSWRALASFYLLGLLVAVGGARCCSGSRSTRRCSGSLRGSASPPSCWSWAICAVCPRATRSPTSGLRISRGIVSRKVQETRLDRVQNVNFDQSVFDRMLSVGTVDFDTAGTDDSEFQFEWVNDPEGVVRSVNDAIHEQRGAGP